MPNIQYRVLESFPEPAFSVLANDAFSDYAPSRLLTKLFKPGETLHRKSALSCSSASPS